MVNALIFALVHILNLSQNANFILWSSDKLIVYIHTYVYVYIINICLWTLYWTLYLSIYMYICNVIMCWAWFCRSSNQSWKFIALIGLQPRHRIVTNTCCVNWIHMIQTNSSVWLASSRALRNSEVWLPHGLSVRRRVHHFGRCLVSSMNHTIVRWDYIERTLFTRKQF